ncbi:hypothetical protein Pam4_21 [Pseudanabaena phage Pam4]|nr:hypothetical protein Pam4_21 [Pseudanabaena phage Pam4]
MVTPDVPLFGGYDPPEEPEVLSPDRRRTARQRALVAAGVHPLTGGPIHALASRHRDPTAARTDPFTCGSCVHRAVLSTGGGSYPKCLVGDGARITHGAATDVRAWWPACPAYSPGEPSLSPDAARWLPE